MSVFINFVLGVSILLVTLSLFVWFLCWLVFSDRKLSLDFLRIYFSARRLHLRDKGETGPVTKGSVYIHEVCRTRIRIGINKASGNAVMYCWKCEKIFDTEEVGKNKGKTSDKRVSASKVVQLFPKK